MSSDLSRLKLVRVGHNMSFSSLKTLGDRVLEAFNGNIESIDIRHYNPPVRFDKIDPVLLSNILDEEIGGHILGITDADLIWPDGLNNFIFGGKNEKNNVAVVSMKRLGYQELKTKMDYKLFFERVLKEALHEEGHNHKLKHHYDLRNVANNSLCPMTKGDFNKYGERAYITAIIDSRGYRFCGECLETLEMFAKH